MDKFVDIHVDSDMEGDGLPYFQKRSTMMVNIVRKMKQELETVGEKKAGGSVDSSSSWLLARDTEDRSDLSLEDEMTRVWEGLWSLGRLDIAGTKAVARLYNLGGPEWFVTVLVERLVSCVYYEDVDRAGEVIFSLLHIDLAANTLTLLLHVLPRCLAGPASGRLVWPRSSLWRPGTEACSASSRAWGWSRWSRRGWSLSVTSSSRLRSWAAPS